MNVQRQESQAVFRDQQIVHFGQSLKNTKENNWSNVVKVDWGQFEKGFKCQVMGFGFIWLCIQLCSENCEWFLNRNDVIRAFPYHTWRGWFEADRETS